jgi:secreted trypsin-like serine protease
MKLIVALIFTVFTISAIANEGYREIDWDEVVSVQDMSGFWDGRELIKPPVKLEEKNRSGRIVGGQVVTPGAHPYHACLLVWFASGTVLCSGTLISGSRILTSASCPIGSSSLQVILGAHTFTAVEPTQQRRNVERAAYRIHPQYNPSNLNNDIAVLILPSSVDITARIQISNLPGSSSATFAGEMGTVTGWGRMSDGNPAYSHQLRSASNTIITNAQCADHYPTRVISSTICMTTQGGRGPCNGNLL